MACRPAVWLFVILATPVLLDAAPAEAAGRWGRLSLKRARAKAKKTGGQVVTPAAGDSPGLQALRRRTATVRSANDAKSAARVEEYRASMARMKPRFDAMKRLERTLRRDPEAVALREHLVATGRRAVVLLTLDPYLGRLGPQLVMNTAGTLQISAYDPSARQVRFRALEPATLREREAERLDVAAARERLTQLVGLAARGSSGFETL